MVCIVLYCIVLYCVGKMAVLSGLIGSDRIVFVFVS